MLKAGYAAILVFMVLPLIQPALAQQTVNITEATPCFLNYTAGWHMLENCNADQDFMTWVLIGWEYISGGYFSMLLVSVIIGVTYIKYKDIIYPIYIGFIFLPISYFVFPQVFLSWAGVMAFLGGGIIMWWAIVERTK